MKKIILLLFLAAATVLSAADLVIAEKGRSDYQIVVPESTGNQRLDHFVTLGGKFLQTAIRNSTGAEVPLVTESKRLPGRPAIIVGNTAALKKANLSSDSFVPWEYAVKAVGKDIFIYGKDKPVSLKNVSLHRFLYYTLGSLKGCCTFAEKFLNTRVVTPELNCDREYEGVRTLPCAQVIVPGSLALRAKPRFTTTGDNGGILYSVANNFLNDSGKKFDVHYIDKVIPAKKYAKTHPEYFAFIDGKRLLREDAPQYCMTNPDVQKIVYEDALRRADIGYTVVELGQQDGFIGCQCEPCKKWYGTSDWGEKMWRFQRDLMEKLQKARPGIQVGIACYGVTHCIPKGFKKFPGQGVFINIAPATKNLLEKWKDFNLTGMNAWAYNMGPYLACGYSPPDSLKKLQKELRFLHSTPATSLYLCQYITSYSLNGPWLYAWGKFMENPDADPQKLLMEYCRFAFGEKAAPGFFKFYSIIDRQMEKFPLENGQDFNDLEGKKPRQSALKLWQNRYPEALLKELEKLFDENIKLCPQNSTLIKRLKLEFTYMRLSAHVCNAIAKLNRDNTAANRSALADALEKRNAFIDSLPVNNRQQISDGFVYTSKEMLRRGGYMAGIFGGAFNSDPKLLRLNAPETTAVKVRDFNDPAWAKAPRLKLMPLNSRFGTTDANFRIGYTDKALLILCEAPMSRLSREFIKRDDKKLWNNSTWEIFIADGERRRQFAFNAMQGSAFDTLIYAYGTYNERWNTSWSHQDEFKGDKWISRVTLPWAGCGRKFEEGMRLQMQFAFSTPGAQKLYGWNIPLSGAFADLMGFGSVRFGTRPKERIIDLDGHFKQVDAKKKLTKWNTARATVKLLPGTRGNMLQLASDAKVLGVLNSAQHIFVEPGEKLEVTVRIKGKGSVSLSGQWRNNAGQWVENESTQWIPLKEDFTLIRHSFTPAHRVQKGAAHVKVFLYLNKGGTSAVIESVSARLTR